MLLKRCTKHTLLKKSMPRSRFSQVLMAAMCMLRGFDGKLKIGILPVSTFCSGHTFFVQRMADVQGLKPYVVHATFQFSGTPGKRHRIRESLLWDAVCMLHTPL